MCYSLLCLPLIGQASTQFDDTLEVEIAAPTLSFTLVETRVPVGRVEIYPEIAASLNFCNLITSHLSIVILQ
jgi:hypothetical protein